MADSGIVLGCLPDFEYEEKTCWLPAGGALVLFTDGVTDAATTSGESFGEARLQQVLECDGARESAELCCAILDKVRAFSHQGDYQDDLTLVVLKRE